jgi:hypothetical protein
MWFESGDGPFTLNSWEIDVVDKCGSSVWHRVPKCMCAIWMNSQTPLSLASTTKLDHDSELELDIIWPILCWPITIIVRKDKWKPRLMIHHFNSCFQPRMFTIESYADSGLIELARGFQWKGGFYHEISVSWKRSIQNWCIIFQKNWLVICLSPLVHFGGWVDRERSCVSCLVMPHDVPTTPKSLGSSPVEITFCLGW